MSLFPININLENRKILIIGGGKVALRKLKKILEFSNNIEILSKDFLEEFQDIANREGIKIEKKEYKTGDIDGFDIVIVATNIKLQREVFYESREKRVFVNSVDSIKYCDFTFSSFTKKGDLLISVSTNGVSPTTAKLLREYIENLIPHNIEKFLKEMKSLRENIPKGKKRVELLREKSKKFFLKNFG